MKFLFVSGVSSGGAPRSTVELAAALVELGHEATVLLGDRPGRNSAMDLGIRSWVKLGRTTAPARLVQRILRLVNAHDLASAPASSTGVRVLVSRAPENAYLQILAESEIDVVVVNSFPQAPFSWIHEDLKIREIPLVLYLREEHALTHVTERGTEPDLLVGNARGFVCALENRGLNCAYIPSVVDLSESTVESTRRVALMVNPVPLNRPDIVLLLADARPDVEFVLQLSWEMEAETLKSLERGVSRLPNVAIRPRTANPADIYRDARLLVAPYPNHRPRVVAEAIHNGIPVLGMDQSSLTDAVGPGGLLVHEDAPGVEWIEAFSSMWDDQAAYEALSAEAREYSQRADANPAVLARRFAETVATVVER